MPKTKKQYQEQEQEPEQKYYKLRCCDARYHADCLRSAASRMYTTRTCIMCRKPVHPMSLFVDLCVIYRGTALHPPSAFEPFEPVESNDVFEPEESNESFEDDDDVPPIVTDEE